MAQDKVQVEGPNQKYTGMTERGKGGLDAPGSVDLHSVNHPSIPADHEASKANSNRKRPENPTGHTEQWKGTVGSPDATEKSQKKNNGRDRKFEQEV